MLVLFYRATGMTRVKSFGLCSKFWGKNSRVLIMESPVLSSQVQSLLTCPLKFLSVLLPHHSHILSFS